MPGGALFAERFEITARQKRGRPFLLGNIRGAYLVGGALSAKKKQPPARPIDTALDKLTRQTCRPIKLIAERVDVDEKVQRARKFAKGRLIGTATRASHDFHAPGTKRFSAPL